jgi:hypothetical protein
MDNDSKTAEEDIAEKIRIREEYLKLFLEEPYFQLPDVKISIIRKGNIMGILFLRIVMKAKGHTEFQKAKILLPRVLDAVFADLWEAMSTLWVVEVDPSPKLIKGRINKVTNEILGKDIVEEIFLKEYFFNRT